MPGCLPIVLEATDVMLSPPPSVVMGSAVVFLLNVMSIPDEVLGSMSSATARESLASLRVALSDQMGAGMSQLYERSNGGSLPIEVSILITCLVSQMFEEALQSVCQSWALAVDNAVASSAWSTSAVSAIVRGNSCIEALTSFRAEAKQESRQSLLSALEENSVADRVVGALTSMLQHVSSGTSGLTSLLGAAATVVSLSRALLQNLGKKLFFSQASSVLILANNFMTSARACSGVIFQGVGLEFIVQVCSVA